MRTACAVLTLAFLVVASGCSSGSEGTELTKDEKEKMDTLFREGIKNPPTPTQEGTPPAKGQGGNPLNAADE
jgi:uncharacterized lipoprotein